MSCQDNRYFCYLNGEFQNLSLFDIARYRLQNLKPAIWSARLSTGVFGLTSCKAGNKGPKGFNEVILGIGGEGLRTIVELGFIPCPVCRPDKINGFWEAARRVAQRRYGPISLEQFLDKEFLPFDSRRLCWEELLPLLGKTPGRCYIPAGVSDLELKAMQYRFAKLGFDLPAVGYYDPGAEDRFTEYALQG